MSIGAKRNLEDVILPIRMMMLNYLDPDSKYQQWEIAKYRDPQEFLDIDLD
jgi:hypothetical protein